MARIDFKEALDGTKANKARNIVACTPNVSYAFINIQSGMLVYSFDAKNQTSLNVYNNLKSKLTITLV